jgi:GntR family transcriptional regulator, negative regulator for fad regulon and positive regulator of fabA
MAPTYARLAIENHAQEVADLLSSYQDLPDTAEGYTSADWTLHQQLTILSSNPIFTLILNGFSRLYTVMGHRYFAQLAGREHSQRFYQDLLECARQGEGKSAENLVQKVMTDSINLWQQS